MWRFLRAISESAIFRISNNQMPPKKAERFFDWLFEYNDCPELKYEGCLFFDFIRFFESYFENHPRESIESDYTITAALKQSVSDPCLSETTGEGTGFTTLLNMT